MTDHDHELPHVPVGFAFRLDTYPAAEGFLRRHGPHFDDARYLGTPCADGCGATVHTALFLAVACEGCVLETIEKVERRHAEDVRAGRYLGHQYALPDGRVVEGGAS